MHTTTLFEQAKGREDDSISEIKIDVDIVMDEFSVKIIFFVEFRWCSGGISTAPIDKPYSIS